MPEGLALSRSRLQALILEGAVATAEGTALEDPRLRLAPGTEVVVSLPEPTPVRAAPEPIPLDVVYEDPDLIVIDKPPGLVVHPAPVIIQPGPAPVYPGVVYSPPVVYTVPYAGYGHPVPPVIVKPPRGPHPVHGYKFYKPGKPGRGHHRYKD